MTTFQEAQRKAKFGHRDWMAYRDRNGEHVVAPLTKSGIKAALLANGTKGNFTLIAANSGTLHRYSWSFGIGMLRNARHIGIPA